MGCCGSGGMTRTWPRAVSSTSAPRARARASAFSRMRASLIAAPGSPEPRSDRPARGARQVRARRRRARVDRNARIVARCDAARSRQSGARDIRKTDIPSCAHPSCERPEKPVPKGGLVATLPRALPMGEVVTAARADPPSALAAPTAERAPRAAGLDVLGFCWAPTRFHAPIARMSPSEVRAFKVRALIGNAPLGAAGALPARER